MKSLKLLILLLFFQFSWSQQFETYIYYTSEINDLAVKNGITYVTSAQTVAKRINDSWVNISPEAFPDPGNYETTYRIHVISENKIYASSIESGSNSKFKIWNGTDWTNIGALPNDARRITDIEYVSDTEIYIGVFKLTSPNKTKVYKFDGTNWTDLNFPDLSDVNIQITYVNYSEIYASTSSSIYLFDNVNWTNITNNYSIGERPIIRVVDQNYKYHSGKSQLVNFANNNLVEIGNLYVSAAEQQGIVDRLIVINSDDIYVSVVKESGSLNAKNFFVSHWNGEEWNRIWSYNSSNFTDDYLSFFLHDENYIYAKIKNRSIYKLDRNTLSIEEFLKKEVTIFPNPVNSFFEVSNSFDTVNLYNSLGQEITLIRESETRFKSPEVSGVYFLKLTIGKKSIVKKIIKN